MYGLANLKAAARVCWSPASLFYQHPTYQPNDCINILCLWVRLKDKIIFMAHLSMDVIGTMFSLGQSTAKHAFFFMSSLHEIAVILMKIYQFSE